MYGGETGIRTLDTLRYTRFPSVRLQPLGHLSANLRAFLNLTQLRRSENQVAGNVRAPALQCSPLRMLMRSNPAGRHASYSRAESKDLSN